MSMLNVASILALGTLYLNDPIDDDWASRWVTSAWHENSGSFDTVVHGDHTYLRTTTDARYYTAARALSTPATSIGVPLAVQYRTGSPQTIDCGGTYIKLFSDPVLIIFLQC